MVATLRTLNPRINGLVKHHLSIRPSLLGYEEDLRQEASLAIVECVQEGRSHDDCMKAASTALDSFGRRVVRRHARHDILDKFNTEEDQRVAEVEQDLEWLKALPERDRRIVLMSEIGYTTTEIATKVGLSRERVEFLLDRSAQTTRSLAA